MEKKIENTIPILPVSNLQDSIQFYTDTLGFSLDWGGEKESKICSVSRDGCAIMLTEEDRGKNVWVWIGLEDESLFKTLRNKSNLSPARSAFGAAIRRLLVREN